MYRFSPAIEKDRTKMIAFAKEQSFAMIVGIGIGDEYPAASQIPLEIIEEGDQLFFSGHLMRKTDHHLAFEKNNHVLVIFTCPHAYIDANWYEDPKSGSTVNYMAVHAKGIIEFTDEAGTRAAVKQITDEKIGKGTPASFDQLPQEYIDRMVKAIVGFKITVKEMEAVFALSRGKSVNDQKNIIDQLEKRNIGGDTFIAGKMKALLT